MASTFLMIIAALFHGIFIASTASLSYLGALFLIFCIIVSIGFLIRLILSLKSFRDDAIGLGIKPLWFMRNK